MSPGLQEVVALLIVLLVVGFALYRRWRRSKDRTACCESTADAGEEKTVHFYRRDSDDGS